MSRPDTRIRLPEEVYNQIKVISGKTGKGEGQVLKEIIRKAEGEGKTLEEIVDEMETKVTRTRGRTSKSTALQREIVVSHEPPKIDPLDRVAEKIEKMLSLKIMSSLMKDFDLTPDQRALLASRNPNVLPSQTTPTSTFSTKDMMDRLTVWKMLEGMEKKESDPAIKDMLKELKDVQMKAIQKPPPTQPQSNIRQRLDELKEYAMTMKIFGTGEEAKQADELYRQELKSIRDDLHKAQMDTLRREGEWRQQDLQRQINEIRNAPTELQQITHLSNLAEKDPAIKAYMNKKLGIKDKGEPLTPEKLKKYIESVEIPVGKILKGVWDLIRSVKEYQRNLPLHRPGRHNCLSPANKR